MEICGWKGAEIREQRTENREQGSGQDNGILKGEYDLGMRFLSKKLAVKSTKEAVNLYNNLRLHSSINFKTPQQIYAA
jgi:transposase InsO family protein